mmetsp:Transcript_1337/g.2442  ORF Transcript_1337/g.2442 Transcript_1337/m.2442 type:complete len:218 (-) Transcript_1337:1311-1964(-)
MDPAFISISTSFLSHSKIFIQKPRINPTHATTSTFRCARIVLLNSTQFPGNSNEIIQEGFVNCSRCGADVMIELKRFLSKQNSESPVKCTECGNKWNTNLSQIDVLTESNEILKASQYLQSKSSSETVNISDSNSIKLFIGGLPNRVTEEILNEKLSQIVIPESVVIVKDKVTNRSRGFAFVSVSGSKNAQAVIDSFHNSVLFGGSRPISVKLAEDA